MRLSEKFDIHLTVNIIFNKKGEIIDVEVMRRSWRLKK
jgi:hypothetical protein